MSLNSPVLASAGWFRYEHKFHVITVRDTSGLPVDLTAKDLVWQLLRQEGDAAALLTKTKALMQITVVGASNNQAQVEVLHSDYTTLPGATYYYVLWDKTDELVIAEGDFVINESGPAI